MISKVHRCIFVHIPKTAGTAIEKDLGLFTTYQWGVQDHRTIRELREATATEDFDGYFKFSFVRNPWDRVVSWYKNVLEEPQHRKQLGVRNECSLREFLTPHRRSWGLKLLGTQRRNWGLQSQLHWIRDSDGRIPMDFIGRFENLEHDYSLVCDRLGARLAYQVKRPGCDALNPSVRVTLRYHNPSASEVLLVWGINDFRYVPKNLPPQSFLTYEGSHVNTPMRHDGEVFTVDFEAPADARLHYAFSIAIPGATASQWFGADSAGTLYTRSLIIDPATGSVPVERFYNPMEPNKWSEVSASVIIDRLLPQHLARAADRRHYTDFYDDKTRRIVADRYADEIELFGYRFGE